MRNFVQNGGEGYSDPYGRDFQSPIYNCDISLLPYPIRHQVKYNILPKAPEVQVFKATPAYRAGYIDGYADGFNDGYRAARGF